MHNFLFTPGSQEQILCIQCFTFLSHFPHIHFFKINYLDERNVIPFEFHWFEFVGADHIKEMWNLAWKGTTHRSNYIVKNHRNVIYIKKCKGFLINHITSVIQVASHDTLIASGDTQDRLTPFILWMSQDIWGYLYTQTSHVILKLFTSKYSCTSTSELEFGVGQSVIEFWSWLC